MITKTFIQEDKRGNEKAIITVEAQHIVTGEFFQMSEVMIESELEMTVSGPKILLTSYRNM